MLTPAFEAYLPGDPDNSTLLIVQPSRHGDVIIHPKFTGETGWQAVPAISLYGRYEMDNQSMQTSFVSLDPVNHLMWPNPYALVPPWLMTVGPLVAGQFTPWTPVLYSSPLFDELTYYFNLAAIDYAGNGVYQLAISNGGAAVNTEGRGSELGTSPAIGPAKMGEALAVGDFNNDGIDDLAVGAPQDVAGGFAGAGRVYIYLGTPRQGGAPGGLHDVPFFIEEPDMTAIPLVGIGENPGPYSGARFGGAVAAGDLDGDGADELVIGVPQGDGVAGEINQGEAYVYRSLDVTLSGLSLPATPTLLPVQETDITQERPVIERTEAQFGMRIACGDLDGDQVADLVVAAPTLDNSLAPADQRVGAAYLFKGPLGPASFVTEDELLQDPTPSADQQFGTSLLMANLDADPELELLVGVPGDDTAGEVAAGKLSVWSYAPTGSVEDTVILHPSPAFAANLGVSVAVGDLDGDGMMDVVAGSNEDVAIVGAPGAMADDAGAAYIFRGPLTGPTAEVLTTPSGPQSFQRFGSALLVADLNSDGYDDIAAAAPGSTVGGMPFGGNVFVYFGGPNTTFNDSFRQLHLKSDTPSLYGLFGMTMAAGDFAGVGVNDLICAEPLATGTGGPGSGRVVYYTDLLHREDNLTRTQVLSGVTPNP